MTPTTTPEPVPDHKTRIASLTAASGAGAKPPALPAAPAASSPAPEEDDVRLVVEKMMDLATIIAAATKATSQALAENKAAIAGLQATLPSACIEAVKREWLLRAGSAEQQDPFVAVKQDLERLLLISADCVGSVKAMFWLGLFLVGGIATVIVRSLM